MVDTRARGNGRAAPSQAGDSPPPPAAPSGAPGKVPAGTHPGVPGGAEEQLKLRRFADLLPALRADAEDAHNARVNGVSRGPGTGLRELDDVLGGVMQPGVHIVQGGSGVGKTAYALQVSRHLRATRPCSSPARCTWWSSCAGTRPG